MMRDVFARLLEQLVAACRQVYGDRLVGVVVYGSVARDRMRPDSDIDVLVVAEPLPYGRGARMREFDEVERLMAGALEEARARGVDTWLSPIVRTPDELDRSGFLVFDIACDGRVLFDPSGRVRAYLEAIRRRLQRRGAQRQTASGRTYWRLDPGVRPGQVVEL